MAMFPDSGVPPADARNSLPDVNTQGCDELWYSTSRCQPRFDPAAANAMLAEQMNLINKGEVSYRCDVLNNVEQSVRYLIQRGIPKGAILWDGPFDYRANLDPGLTRYSDYLTLVVIPSVHNQGAMKVNIDGLGLVPILRNDYQPVESMDFKAGFPTLISYWNGNFFHVGLLPSQVPLVVKGAVDIWIRTDGSDELGDGSANSPDKAFKTIAGAWGRVGSRYASTPLFTMNMKLGIPGDYAGARLGPFGGRVTLSGDRFNRAGYRITSIDMGQNTRVGLSIDNVQFQLSGVTLMRDMPAPYWGRPLRVGGGTVAIQDVDFDSTQPNALSCFIEINGGSFLSDTGTYSFYGRNLDIGQCFATNFAGNLAGCGSPLAATWWFSDCKIVDAATVAKSLSTIKMNSLTTINTINCTGQQYMAVENSVINWDGRTLIGNVPGTISSGGQFIR